MKRRKKLGLALGSGGARGFCHIGFLEVLQENNIHIDIVTGCSMGALIAGGVAAGVTTAQMREIAGKIKTSTAFDVDIFRALREGGLAKGDRAMKIYKQVVGEKLIEDCDIKFAAIAADLKTRQLHTFKTGTIWQAVRASIAIPGIFQPVRMDDMVLVDGGVLKRMPIGEARELGADIVIAVDAIGAPYEDSNVDSLMGILELSYQIREWNWAQYEGKDADLLIVPDIGKKSVYKFKDNEATIQSGRDAAIAALPQILKLVK